MSAFSSAHSLAEVRARAETTVLVAIHNPTSRLRGDARLAVQALMAHHQAQADDYLKWEIICNLLDLAAGLKPPTLAEVTRMASMVESCVIAVGKALGLSRADVNATYLMMAA